MLQTASFELDVADDPLTGPVSKFGGKPHWDGDWPLSSASGEPMTFLAQVRLEPPLFTGQEIGRMALLFFDQEQEPLSAEGFAWTLRDSDGSVISRSNAVDFDHIQGPMLFELDNARNAVHKEYHIIEGINRIEDPVSLTGRYQIGDLDYSYGYRFSHAELAGNKLGGQPLYVGQLTVPPEEFHSDRWDLLLQLAPRDGYWNHLQPNFYPFLLELGEFGILSVFISSDRQALSICPQQP